MFILYVWGTTIQGYSTCGIENQDAHYSGNFWWADCQHVAALNPPHTRFDAWAYEFFVLKVAQHNYHHSRFRYSSQYFLCIFYTRCSRPV